MTSQKTNFGKVITAMVTPFNPDRSVNYAKAEELAAHLMNSGSDGIVVCGTTGESPTLTWDEEYQLFQVVQKATAPKVKIIAGTGSNSTREAISATQKAAKLGLDGSLQVVPYYNKPPQAGLYQHFRSIAKACPDLPIVLYNVPGRTGRNLEPETVASLAEIDNIVAIKEASGDLEAALAIRRLTSDSFAIYSGEDVLTLPMLTAGAVGVVSVASHLVGKEIQAMISAYESGENLVTKNIQLKLYPLFKALFCTTNPIPIKAALNLLNWQVGGLRSPLNDPDEELTAKLKPILEELNLD